MLVSALFQQKQQTKRAQIIDQNLTLSDTANKRRIIDVDKASQKVTDMKDGGREIDKVQPWRLFL